MKMIGITGGIASGKTMVTDYLAGLGAPVVDADVISHRVTEKGSPVLGEIAAAFGEEYLDEEGNLRRQKLGELIFQDQACRMKLNRLIHPKISGAIQEEIKRHEDAGEPFVIFSAPLLIEGGKNSMADEIWVVSLEPEEQILRLMARDGIGREAAMARLGSQSSLEEKLAIADRVIDNNGSREEACRQAKALWESLHGS
ncbi:MAG: dephospho-CoA kinase [Clostridiales bacterium]|nr:dephospho-CoA kinase [Clostridiales bacterium]